MEMKYEKEAKVFKAFCDPNRLMILETLQNGEKCACKLLEELDIVQSTLSHHMKILCEAGFVNVRREGKWMHYSINKQGFEMAKKYLTEFEKKE
ncbi:MAG: metalloregulator ArsR/SmtB family transcription factor [Mobilitalea sp.]